MRTHTTSALRVPPQIGSADTMGLWAEFERERTAGIRERLILAYAGFARIMAAKVYAKRVYTEMEFADYLQYAHIGLVESIDRFEPGRGFKFETFAAKRINGAMLNGIERSSEIQEQIAARKRVVTHRVTSLNEGASLPAGPDAVFARLAELAIGLAVGFALEDSGMHRGDDAEYADNSYHGVELKQLQARIQSVLADLAANQKQVIQSHYLQRMAFEDIAATMCLSPGRVAQIHKEALGNLRTRLRSWGEVNLSC